MLWLSLNFPRLPLDLLARACCGTKALAVFECQGSRQRIQQCNPAAAREGLHPGMSLQAALALAPELICRPRDPVAEQQALQRLATWASRFSSLVSLSAVGEVLLEVGASMRLFGGREAFVKRLQSGLAELGYHVHLAAAPTPTAASLLARAGEAVWVMETGELVERLRPLSVRVLPVGNAVQQALEAVGIRYLGELLAQPQDAVARRFGGELARLLERAQGRCPDPLAPHVPASRFEARMELPAAVRGSEPLLFAAKRLLSELAGILEAKGEGVNVLRFLLFHPQGQVTRVRIGLTRPGRDVHHWLGLVREKLERTSLPREVEALSLQGGRQFPLPARTGDLFDDGASISADAGRLLERLEARLGQGVIAGIRLLDDHRPERAWCPGPPGLSSGRETGCAARPLWLLQQPVHLEAEAHCGWRLRGLERLESGWWDGADVARDYFLAETPDGERLWVYRDRRSQNWFLHGLFA
jgi:protein ImuB